MNKKREIASSVKDESLIEKRREQMIRGAVTLFKEKGFHRTTTREIAKAAGFSIGTLYEYIRTKEDVLYLVCDSIYDEVHTRLDRLDIEQGSINVLVTAIEHYYTLIDDMQDEFVVMYQESKSLPKDALSYVLNKEIEMVALFERLLTQCVDNGEIKMTPKEVVMASHHLFVQGQMWAFRRWALRDFTIQEFIDMQTKFLLQGMAGENISIQGA
ncbi:TetR/AcrR family transcriptional regulator [Microbacterium sp. APC 3898]|uniref:TetR/AcrR family transcriptional regulator n=1 Tax=Planococcus notacanthi TaxID=3035188 RepID=A0ABT7ZL15_9BACL|nr:MULTISPECIES: TetR/AcrR family transcriptional regulator [Terrabacteria group]MBF6633566.1 TetR/AcrR family transcriptional regulator [Planococcus sp. (in: firmicutes)]MDN3427852.1 TetR/AcrR family transcriptional regulator [Planococcus sp. APC 4016]MDN3437206.1 TetR/AcrR family transcriptional regulator [Planococcus sp. APC 3900]MDN3499404.1 TetR/AcrR family transcriptional regulator [Microbacterium sp. APC 3898]